MKKFLRRLLFYVIGLGIGSLAVWFFMMKDRTDLPAVWPGKVVKQNIRNSVLSVDTSAQCMYDCYHLNDSLVKAFVSGGKVRFGISEPRKEPWPEYVIDGKLKGLYAARMRIESGDSLSILKHIEILPGSEPLNCSCP